MLGNGSRTDLEQFLQTQGCNGGEHWASHDGALARGGPFSTLEAGIILSELGCRPSDTVVQGLVETIFRHVRADGRIPVYPTGAIYPCQTANAARTLCYLGSSQDPRLSETFRHFLGTQQDDGGWRCNSFKFGRGPETAHSNPGPTLTILDLFRFAPPTTDLSQLNLAVDFLLRHWVSRLPIGPCHYGIGSRFLKIEFPMFRYNLLHYVYTLSFYQRARSDPRFLEALTVLTNKTRDGMLFNENPNRKLADYSFAKPGEKNTLATLRYQEILRNLDTRGDRYEQ